MDSILDNRDAINVAFPVCDNKVVVMWLFFKKCILIYLVVMS